MAASSIQPRLRSTITGHVDPRDPAFVWLYDSARISRSQVRIRREAIAILEFFTGENTVEEIHVALVRQMGGRLFPSKILEDLVGTLDEALFLEGERFRSRLADFLSSPDREPTCIGTYEEDPNDLRQQLRDLFTSDGGPGLPGDGQPDGALCGAFVPHMDYFRGGKVYAHGFKEIIERTDATTFVIIATSHYSRHRFILTRKNFKTPLGTTPTDQDYVSRIAAAYGEKRAFEDEMSHLPEHSIELEVVLLQYLLEGRRPFKIVPLLVGSFHDCVAGEGTPEEREDIYLMTQALRHAEAAGDGKVCYLISGDLAHIGPKFGDTRPVHEEQLSWSRQQDQLLLNNLEEVNRNGFFHVLKSEEDQRRICGFPPAYTTLSVFRPTRGKVLSYNQYVEPNGHESVSYASVGFYRE